MIPIIEKRDQNEEKEIKKKKRVSYGTLKEEKNVMHKLVHA
jgi:hypothetical protein